MQNIKREVFVVISEIVEKLCLQKSKLNTTEVENNFPGTVNKDDILLCNEISQSRVKLAIFHDVNAKTKEVIIMRKELNAIASTDNCRRKEEHYLKFFNALREEFINKYDIHHKVKNPERLGREDVFVQTVSETPATIDSEVQCDLLPVDSSTFILAENIGKPKMNLRNRCYSYMNYEKTHCQGQSLELPQTEPEPLDLGQNQSNKVLKSATHIRIGLSKRFKSRSAQKP